MIDDIDVVVVGAGVCGLAIARALALTGREVVVLEKHVRVGQETSSRNSGVIHSGIYYPADSSKAKFCVRGRDLLYEYCARQGIAYRRLGKVIVAQENQLDALMALRARGALNGVSDLQLLTASQVRKIEPRLDCAAGLFSPSTGIIDVHEYLMSLWADLEAAHGTIAFASELMQASSSGDRFVVTVRSAGATTSRLRCKWLINSAGLHAIELLTRIEGYPQHLRKTPHWAKGSYFAFHGGKPFNHLVYPMPSEAGLGVHATLDLSGAVRFGPDVEWVAEPSYDVDAQRADAFYAAIRQYWPDIPAGSLQPAYAGIRPKLAGAGATTAADFLIEDHSAHCMPGLINLLGIESPGLTSSLAIAEYVSSSLCSNSRAAVARITHR